MNVLKSPPETDYFLDELKPIVESRAIIVVWNLRKNCEQNDLLLTFREVSKGSLKGLHPEWVPMALENMLFKVLAASLS